MHLVKPSFQILSFPEEPFKIIEVAGRTCFKSEHKISDTSAEKFVANILKSGHESVIEHASATVKIVCDRGILVEISRHRLISLSVESTRYVNYAKKGLTFIIPHWITDVTECECVNLHTPEHSLSTYIWLDSLLIAEYTYLRLIEESWTPEQARSVLPNALKTEIVITANMREWRHIFNLRCSSKAHPQMREIMIPILDEFYGRCPVLFEDLYKKYIVE